MRKTINGSPGLYTAANAEIAPPGSLSVAKGVVIRRPGLIQKARPWRQYGYGGDSTWTDPTSGTVLASYGLGYFSGRFYVTNRTGELWRDNGSMVFTDLGYRVYGGNATGQSSSPRRGIVAVEARGNYYMQGIFRTSASVTLASMAKVDATTGTPYAAGCPRALDPILSSLASGTLYASGKSASYRVVFTFTDANGNFVFGAPSGPVNFTATGAQDVSAKCLLPADIYNAANATSYRVQLYRSNIVPSGSNPDDEMQLVADYGITSTDVSNKYVTIFDNTPDELKGILGGGYLYTNPSQQTIAAANYAPPIAADIAFFKASMFFANTTQKHRASMTMLGPPEAWAIQQIQANTPIAGQSTYTFLAAVDLTGFDNTMKLSVTGTAANDGTWAIVSVNNGTHTVVVTNAGVAAGVAGSAMSGKLTIGNTTYFPIFGTESVANRYYNVPSSGTSQAKVAAATKSLVAIANQQTAADVVLYNVTNPLAPAGEIQLEEKSIGGSAFTVKAEGTTTAGYRGAYSITFAPACPAATPITSLNDAKANRLHFSKTGQPEHCPLSDSYYFDIGAASKAILRIIPLRNALLVFKEDGLFRVTGDSGVFAWTPVDPTQVLLAATLAESMQNTAIAVTGRGVWQFTETSARLLSGPLADRILQFTSGASSTRNVLLTSDAPPALSVNETDGTVFIYVPMQASTGDTTVCLIYCLDSGGWTETWASSGADGISGQVDFASMNFVQVNGARYGILRTPKISPAAVNKTFDIYVEDQFAYPSAGVSSGTNEPHASGGEPTPGHKYFMTVTAVDTVAGTITATSLAGPSIRVGDLVCPAARTSVWSVSAVNGTTYTLTRVFGSQSFASAFSAAPPYRLPRTAAQPIQIDYNPITMEDDGSLKTFKEVAAILDPASTTTAGSVSIGCYTENLSSGSMTSVADTRNTATSPMLHRIGVERKAQTARRLAVRITHSNPLEYFYLRGISVSFEPVENSTATN